MKQILQIWNRGSIKEYDADSDEEIEVRLYNKRLVDLKSSHGKLMKISIRKLYESLDEFGCQIKGIEN